jgi:hypothetical protein
VRWPSVPWMLDAVVPTLVLQKVGLLASLTDADWKRLRDG